MADELEDVTLPNGAILENVPVGTSDDEVAQEAVRLGLASWEDFKMASPPSGMDYVSGLAGQVAQGAFASFGDEVAAGAAALTAHLGDSIGLDTVPEGHDVFQTYYAIRDNIRAANENFRQHNPNTALAANVVGGMLPISRGMNAAKGMGAMGTTAVAVGAGAGWGLADYLGELESFTDFEVLAAAKRVGLGAAIPAGLNGGRGVWHWLKNREKDEVAAILKELQEHTHRTTAEIQEQANRMGPDASLVDATGDVGVGYAQAAKGVGAMDVADTVQKNMWPKLAKAKDRIRGTLQKITGKGEDEYFDTIGELTSNRRARARKLYGKAIDEGGVEPTEKMVTIMNQNPSVRDAYQRVADKWARQGKDVPKIFEIDELTGKVVKRWRGGEDVSREVPNMRFLQEMKFELDGMTSTMSGSMDSAGKLAYRRLLDDKHEFLDEIYSQNKVFKKANEVFAGDIALETAQKMGRKHGLGRGNVEEQIEFIKGLTKSEKAAYLQGLMSDVYNTLGKSGMGEGGAEMLGNLGSMTSHNAKKVLKELLGEKKTNYLMKTIQTQKRFKEVDTKVRHGSETAPRQAAVESLKRRNQEFNLEDLKGATLTGQIAESAPVKKLMSMLPSKYGKLGPQQLNELVDLMTKPNGTAAAIARMKQAGYNEYEISELMKYITSAGIATPSAVGPQEAHPTPVYEGLFD